MPVCLLLRFLNLGDWWIAFPRIGQREVLPMKKLLNNPKDAVKDMIEGLVAMHPHLAQLSDFPGVIVRKDIAHDATKRDTQ